MMPESDNVRANINAPISDSPIETSYETICALERSPPSSAYFEFDDQPASINASTPTLDTANTSSKPIFTSAITAQSGPNGITENTMKAEATAIYGAKKKIQRSAFSGMKSSLVSSLRPSAIGCSSPHGPTRIGPSLACINAEILRSRYVAYATHSATSVTTMPIWINGQMKWLIVSWLKNFSSRSLSRFIGPKRNMRVSAINLS